MRMKQQYYKLTVHHHFNAKFLISYVYSNISSLHNLSHVMLGINYRSLMMY